MIAQRVVHISKLERTWYQLVVRNRGFKLRSIDMKKVLLVDHSGRGHAFADLFVRTNPEVLVYYAPGCAAITTERVISLPHLKLAMPESMAAFAHDEQVDFVFVANTQALANGFTDVFRQHGLPTIGPDQQASRLEA